MPIYQQSYNDKNHLIYWLPMLGTLTTIFESYLDIVHNMYLTMALLFVFGLLDHRMTLIAKKLRERKHAEFF